MRCPECSGEAGRDCVECHGVGRILIRGCPLCGDIGWDYVNGISDCEGMACRISCGCRWTADDPGRRAQVLPLNSE